jgi:tRNA-dihydrouridine synthase B
MKLGSHVWMTPLALAPMAGVTDRPFRMLCRSLGADLAASEMVTADQSLWHTNKSKRRLDHSGEPEPRIVQIAGGEPMMMADAARRNAALGAQIIDINMGCPAKKVCNRAAGSALLKDEPLVAAILDAVVRAVDIPVTLKMRTGWDANHKNGVAIARLAETAGIQGLAVHGRTRTDHYQGAAEYSTIQAIKAAVNIPVLANGDIIDGPTAQKVLKVTGADGLMIGRAAQGNPWIFREVAHYLATGKTLSAPAATEVRDIMTRHLEQLYVFYGEQDGVRVARKHLGWYRETVLKPSLNTERSSGHATREQSLFQEMRIATTTLSQLDLVRAWFDVIAEWPSAHQDKSEQIAAESPLERTNRLYTTAVA